MIVRPHLHWFRLLFVWRGSVLPYIATRLLLVVLVAVLSVLSRSWWMSEHATSALSIPPFTLMGIALAIGWLTPLIATFVAYTFLALDVIGEQIEEPFGTEPNDLALASMCHAIEVSLCELVGEVPFGKPPQVIDYVMS